MQVGIVKSTNAYNSGAYKIEGNVTGVTGSRKIRLYDRFDHRVIDQTYSNATTGSYSFTYKKNQEYYAIAIDHENVWNIAVADRCVVVPM